MRLRARPFLTSSLAVLAAGALAAAACARNPVTGNRELALVSEEQEIQLGQQAAKEIAATMPPYKDEKLQAYVRGIGMRMAKQSERPNLPWTFTVIDDPTVNAFALPGGPIFVTRGILAHLNSEAELASVIGHEIGHVTARHSVQQMSKAQLAQLGLGLGSVFSETVAQYGGVAAAGLQMLFLKYGRDAERQSDELGFKYMVKQGYDPNEMDDVFVTLQRASDAAGAGRVPEWASTHPDPGNRAKAALERAKKAEVPNAKVGRDELLAVLGGVTYGDDPRQGYFEGNTFYHPGMRFKLSFPAGFKTQNTAAAVVGVSEKQDAMVQLALAGQVSPEDAAKKFLSQEGLKAGKVEEGTIGGKRATASEFEAQTQQGVLRGVVTFVSHGGQTFMLLGYAPAEAYPTYGSALQSTIRSFADLSDPAKIDVSPARLELVRLDRAMSLQEFMQRYPSTAPIEQIAIINGLTKDGSFRSGDVAKRVVGGVKPR
jgi:predicted Zn-dependent protease